MASLAHDYRRRPANREVAGAYLTYLRDVKRCTALTVYQYAAKLDDLFEYLHGTDLDLITTEQLEGWLQRPRKGRGHGRQGQPATLGKEVAILRGLYRFANARGLVANNPTVLLHAPAVRNKHPRAIPDDVWIRVWETSDLPQDALLAFGLGYFCGFRRAEIANLRVDQIDLAGERFVGFTRKGGGDDVMGFSDLLWVITDTLPQLITGGPERFTDALAKQVANAQGPMLFDWTATSAFAQRVHTRSNASNDPQLIYKRFQRWLRACDLEPGERFTPHQLRHSFVTNLLRAGVPIHLVSVLANHSDISITMRYAKLGGQDLREFRQTRSLKAGRSRFED